MSVTHQPLDVYIAGAFCGQLTENKHGEIAFEYTPEYQGVPLSLSMPVGLARYGDKVVRPYLMGLLPDESAVRNAIGAEYGISGNNPFRLLEAIGLDCPGAVQVVRKGAAAPDENAEQDLVKLSEEDVEAKLAAVRENAAAAWVDASPMEGHWSLAGCQAKFTLREQDGTWFDCKGSAASTHIVKPGVSGFDSQAFVEFVSMRTAEAVGLPVARADYCTFGAEPAIVVKRYDRVRDGANRVRRIHQEDFCQALGVMPDAKYAEQGGPSALKIIALLKTTGSNARENVYRFILYTFFNYLIGATDAHAKNHTLLFLAPGDIRLAPLYDVASIAPYRSLAPMKRKPLRAALSIGGENRFGLLGAEHVGKMVRDSNLEEFGLGAGMLCARLADMAKLVPKALAKVLAEVRSCGTSDKDAVAEAMQREITANCERLLARM